MKAETVLRGDGGESTHRADHEQNERSSDEKKKDKEVKTNHSAWNRAFIHHPSAFILIRLALH
jgi:hypothetical protein